jgi:hypothetical protein
MEHPSDIGSNEFAASLGAHDENPRADGARSLAARLIIGLGVLAVPSVIVWLLSRALP